VGDRCRTRGNVQNLLGEGGCLELDRASTRGKGINKRFVYSFNKSLLKEEEGEKGGRGRAR